MSFVFESILGASGWRASCPGAVRTTVVSDITERTQALLQTCRIAEAGQVEKGVRLMFPRWPDGPVARRWLRSKRTIRHPPADWNRKPWGECIDIAAT